MARIISLARARAVRSPAPTEPPARRELRPAFIALLTALALFAAVAVVTVSQLRAARELDALSPDIRRELYQRNLDQLRNACVQPAASVG